MRTPKQTEASRANGARSKGPVTPQGKYNSSRNSTRHGMFADTIVLEAEDKTQFLELLDDLFEEHQPRTRTQIMFVEIIAAARWRQDRIFGMQRVAFDYDVASAPAEVELNPLRAVISMRSPESARTHELLLRYEVALDRQISRALLRLHQLQDREAKVCPQCNSEFPVLRDSKSAKGAERSAKPSAEPIAPHSVLRDSKRSAKGAAHLSAEPIAPHSVLRDPKEPAPEKRTQQPVETDTPLILPTVRIPQRPAPQNQTSAPEPASSTPSHRAKAGSMPPLRRKSDPDRKKSAA